jgi:general secretion pathway protein C
MNKRLPVVTSFMLFLLLCASITYWVLEFVKPPQRPLAAIMPTAATDAPLEAAAGLFGGSTVKVAMASNFQLKGVVAAGNANESIAIVVANGKPQQSIRVNTEVQPGVVVKEVHGQYVLLTERGVTRRVDMQELVKNPLQSPPSQPLSQFTPSVVPPQRIETPPPTAPMPTQTAPAMPTTMIMPGQVPPSQMQPPAPPGQQYGGAVVIPPGSSEPSGPQRNHSSH